MTDVKCFKCHKKANKCPDAKAKDGKDFFKVRQLEDLSKDEKSIRKIRIRHPDLNHSDFLFFDTGSRCGPVRDAPHPGYLAHVFIDTGTY